MYPSNRIHMLLLRLCVMLSEFKDERLGIGVHLGGLAGMRGSLEDQRLGIVSTQ